MRKSIIIAAAVFCAAVIVFFVLTQYVHINSGQTRSQGNRTPRIIIYKYSWGEIVEQETDLVYKELQRRFRDEVETDIEVAVIEGTDYGVTLDVGLAAGEQIDAFLIGGNQLGYWYRRGGVITPLNSLLERYGPDLLCRVPQRLWDQVTIDGQILSIPGYSDARGSCIIVRKDVLDRFGLPVPTTVEELTDVSLRLRELNPAVIPITGAWWDFGTLLCPALGIEHWEAHIIDDEKKLIYTGNKEENFYKFFVQIRRWYDEDLLDREFLSANFDRIKELFFEGRTVFTFNHVERTNDWARELSAIDEKAEIAVITELNGAGVYSLLGEIPHHLIIPQYSEYKKEVIQYVNWVFKSAEHYHLVHLGLEGKHYSRQAHSFVPVEPVRYRGVFTPVVNKDYSLPNANMFPLWYSSIEEVQKVQWKTDVLRGKVFLDTAIEREYPSLLDFDHEWWKYLDGRLEPTAENYRQTVALYFENGGEEISRSYYRQYEATLGK